MSSGHSEAATFDLELGCRRGELTEGFAPSPFPTAALALARIPDQSHALAALAAATVLSGRAEGVGLENRLAPIRGAPDDRM